MPQIIPTDQVTLASVTTTLTFMQRDITEIKQDIKNMPPIFASKEELANTAIRTNDRISRLEKESRLWRWVSPTFAAIVAVIVEYLFIFYIQHLHP